MVIFCSETVSAEFSGYKSKVRDDFKEGKLKFVPVRLLNVDRNQTSHPKRLQSFVTPMFHRYVYEPKEQKKWSQQADQKKKDHQIQFRSRFLNTKSVWKCRTRRPFPTCPRVSSTTATDWKKIRKLKSRKSRNSNKTYKWYLDFFFR